VAPLLARILQTERAIRTDEPTIIQAPLTDEELVIDE
jgi:hypothetical protein